MKIEVINEIKILQQLCQTLNISLFNIGYASKPETIDIIPDINKNTLIIYYSSKIGDRETSINFENIRESAKAIKRISQKVKAIVALLIDMATLTIKLDKPLSARLFPIINKKAGEMTTFNSPYFVDCKIFTVN